MKIDIILVGIAMMLLLALPAAASDYTLGVFGNANEDDTINMQDVTYTELIILEYRDRTELSDAKYDGKINMQDVTQIELVILGREKELTLLDNIDRVVTIPKPVERVVSTFPSLTRVIVELGGVDKLVGVSDYMTMAQYSGDLLELRAYPQLKDIPCVGSYRTPNLEQIVALKPDVVISSTSIKEADVIQTNTCIPTIGLSTSYPYEGEGGAFEGYRLAGRVIGEEERAEYLISFVNDEFDKIREVTSEIPDDERVRVYYMGWGKITRPHMTEPGPIEIAGGINVAADSGYGWNVETTKEQVIEWNPDVILIHSTGKSHFGGTLVEDVLSDTDLQSINAVKNGKVYYSKGGYIGRNPATGVTEVPYMAKLFYPDKFEDLDVEEEGNRILEEFYGVDGLYTWMQENCDLYRWETE